MAGFLSIDPSKAHGGEHIHANLESSGMVTERAANSISPQPKSDLSDFGQSKRPNLGKPEFGWERSAHEVRRVRGAGSLDRSGPPHPNPLPKWGEGAHRGRGTAGDPLGPHWNGVRAQAEPRSNRFT